jgi:hypothetical protein
VTKLTAIVERPVRLQRGSGGAPANALVNFSGTVPLVALTAVRHGKPVAGVAFDSIGRFAQSGMLRDRMIPRVLAASPDALLDDSGRIDPAAVLACALTDEKPGGQHLINLHIVAGLCLGGCESYPGVFQPFGAHPDGCVVTEGRIAPADAPGFGLEQQAGLAELTAELTA